MAKAAKTQSSRDNSRVFFTKQDDALEVPQLIAHQSESWRDFVETGLGEIFAEINPIEDYTGQKLELRFKDYQFGEAKTTDQFAKENNLTFEAPLTVNVELTNKVSGNTSKKFMGDYL